MDAFLALLLFIGLIGAIAYYFNKKNQFKEERKGKVVDLKTGKTIKYTQIRHICNTCGNIWHKKKDPRSEEEIKLDQTAGGCLSSTACCTGPCCCLGFWPAALAAPEKKDEACIKCGSLDIKWEEISYDENGNKIDTGE